MTQEKKDCGYCVSSRDAPEEQRRDGLFLTCHFNAPNTDAQGQSIWPLVSADNCCDQFEPDEE